MAEEAWLSGKLEGFAPVMMPAAHALVQAIDDLLKTAANLTGAELYAKPHGAASPAFHLRHIAGSCDRLLTYAKGENLSAAQFEFSFIGPHMSACINCSFISALQLVD